VDAVIFYILATVVMFSAIAVVLMPNPIYAALMLAITMTSVAAIFFNLNAYFLAGVQLIVYAGAVMVLFVMVLMLFNLKEERQAFSKGVAGFLLKMAASGFILGIILSSVHITLGVLNRGAAKGAVTDGLVSTKELALTLFTKYVVQFESVGILLLVVLIGAIALARSKGGTHAH
jgi:NADH-quinone oxidoreductase subunit J